jgi:transcriptional regulator with XRE-family HTH domain
VSRPKRLVASAGCTPLGNRILQVLGVSQRRIAHVLGITPQALNNKMHGSSEFTATDLMMLAREFDVHAGLFFGDMTMDGDVLRELYNMFRYDPLALDAIIDVFRADKKLLRQLGEMAQQLCTETKKESGST